jgi:hypothetical protein
LKRTPNNARLAQYRTLEDLWQDNLHQWLARASQYSTTDQPAWIVLSNLSQSHWIRTRAFQENIPLHGIKFLDAALLRTELCHHLQLSYSPVDPVIFEFLLAQEATHENSSEAQSIALQAAPWLKAIKTLVRAHGSFDHLPLLPTFFKSWREKIKQTKLWHPDIYQSLLSQSSRTSPFLMTCFVSWDAECLPRLDLLKATYKLSQEIEIYVPMPRITGRDPDVTWIQTLEHQLQLNCETCQDSGYESPNTHVASHLFLNQKANPPSIKLFLAKNNVHQIQIILQQIELLSQSTSSLPIGIITPQNSSATLQLINRLKQTNLLFHQELELRTLPFLNHQFLIAYFNYLQSHCHVEKFILFIEIIYDMQGLNLPKINALQARKRLYQLFKTLPTPNITFLAKLLNSKNALDSDLLVLLSPLSPWPQNITWHEAKQRLQQTLDFFQLPFSWEKYFPEFVQSLFNDKEISTEKILELLQKLISSENIQEPNFETSASVILTTHDQAFQRQWSHLLFLECNEPAGQPKTSANPLLNDKLIKNINQLRSPQQTYLLSNEDLSMLERRRFLDLCENCEGTLTLIANETDLTQPLTKRNPNEWFRQALNLFPDSLQTSEFTTAPDIRPSAFDQNEFIKIHQSRQNPEKPFDKYCFNFSTLDSLNKTWHARNLQQALQFPATFAFRSIWQAESMENYHFHFNSTATTGTWAWNWMKTVFQTQLEKPWQKEIFFSELQQLRKHWLNQLTQYLEIEPLSLWWQTLVEKSFWMANQYLNSLWEVLPRYTDYQIEPSFSSLEKNLPLNLTSGCDLLLIEKNEEEEIASLHFINFYANYFKGLNFSHLEQNQGLQYAANLIFKTSIERMTVSCLTPYQGLIPIFTKQDQALARPYFEKLALLQKNNDFGMKGPLYHSNQKTETLPLATRPISEKTLVAKHDLNLEKNATL